MALRSSLVDRGRQVEQTGLPQRRVAGTTLYTPLIGNWFKCRFTVDDGAEISQPDGGVNADIHGALLFGIKDTERQPVLVKPGNRIQIVTNQPSFSGTYEVTSKAKPIRKKRRMLGWECNVSRVDEEEAEAVIV